MLILQSHENYLKIVSKCELSKELRPHLLPGIAYLPNQVHSWALPLTSSGNLGKILKFSSQSYLQEKTCLSHSILRGIVQKVKPLAKYLAPCFYQS